MNRENKRTVVRGGARALGLAIPFVLLLTACGGGGGGGGGDSAASGSTGAATSAEQGINYDVVHGGTQEVVVSWAAPTQRVGGQSLSMAELAGYRIYYGPADSKQAFVIQVDDPYRFESAVSDLRAGTYYFAITAVDGQGRESMPSNELSAIVS